MRPILLHGHLFKNAGSTFDWSLRRSFKDGFLDHRDDSNMRQGGTKFLTSLIQENPSLMAISSHVMPLMLTSKNEINPIPVYFLRHPILRVRSVYEFELKQTPAVTPGAIEAKKKNFKDYVDWRLDERVGAIIRNYHSRYLGGLRRRGSSSKGDHEDFERAMQTLEKTPFTPIVESYDASMIILEDILKPTFPAIDLSYVPQNVITKRASVVNIEDDLFKMQQDLGKTYIRLSRANQLDLSLYDAGVELLNYKKEKLQITKAKLKNFLLRCSHLREGN